MPLALDAVALAVAPAAVLDLWPWPLLVLHADGTALFANASARGALERGRGGLGVEGSQVAPLADEARPRWLAALRAAACGEPCLVRLGAGGARPVASLSCAPATRGRGLVVCVLEGGETLVASRVAAYARMHGLTAGEAQVLARLAAGESVKRVASSRGSSEATVRSQVKTILAKTGRHSIRDAVTDLLRCPPLLDPDEASRAP
ncbi:MAG: helix-turn-helix transcriptional regulator [Burkholderiales bacterium]